MCNYCGNEGENVWDNCCECDTDKGCGCEASSPECGCNRPSCPMHECECNKCECKCEQKQHDCCRCNRGCSLCGCFKRLFR